MKLFLPLFLCCAGALFFVSCTDETSHQQFLAQHSFAHSKAEGVRYEDIPKKDRPDLAWEQNYLATMDPKLQRPAPERLVETRTQVKEYFEAKRGARTGTQESPWVERGPNNVGGRTRAIMWDPNDSQGKKVWAGGVTGGLWYTNDIYDDTESWTQVDGFWDNISIVCIAFDPNDNQIFYVGTGEGFGAAASRGAGIWKTTDGGASWASLSSTSDFHYVNDIIVRDESGTSAIYAGTRGNFYNGEWHATRNEGLHRSTDGGASFSQVMPATSSSSYAAADIELGADNRIWVGCQANAYGEGGGTIFFSDNGTDWTQSTVRSNASRVEMATAASDANTVYALIEGSSVISEIIKSSDGGSSWSNLEKPNDADTGIPASDFTRGQAWYDLIMEVDPNDADVVLVGGIDLFKSSDGGSSWNQISHWYGGFGYPNVHADQHAIAFKPGSSTDVIFGNDGGMFISADMASASPSFTNRNQGYNVTQFYAGAIHPDAGENYFLAGAQDNGTQKFVSAGMNATTQAYGGDGAFCFIDQQDGDIQIVSYVYNVYSLSTNGGQSFSDFVDDQESGSFINPADYDNSQGILYAGHSSTKISRYLNVKSGSPSRSNLDIALGSEASHFRVSPYTTSSSTLFVGTQAGDLYKLTDAGNTASSSNIKGSSFPDGNISCVEIGSSEDELLVTFSNYGVTSIWYSSDGGSNWSSKEGNLPDMPVRWALFNPENRAEVILATELGIWRTVNFDDSSPTWTASNVGLANVRIDMLQIRASDNEVLAITHGRGLFTSNGFAQDNQTGDLVVEFEASAESLSVGETIDFYDLSAGSPSSWSWTFEGGDPSSSTLQNPSVSYEQAGTYSVSLTIQNAENESDSKTVANYITVIDEEEEIINLIFYKPDTWANPISVSNEKTDYDNTAILAEAEVIYMSYAIANTGNASVTTDMIANISLDGNELNTTNWNFSANALDAGFYVTSLDLEINDIAEGEHTLTISLDDTNVIDESDETDNELSYTFSVQQSCAGITTLTTANGSITDGSDEAGYANNRNCEWVIEPEDAESITIMFNEFGLEQDYDFLNIYAGSDENNAVASLTGSAIPADITVEEGKVIIVFTTDISDSGEGWDLSYESTITKRFPDLVVNELAAIEEDEQIIIDATIENIGDGDLGSEINVNFYLSADEALTSDDQMLINESLSSLAASEQHEINASVSIPEDVEGDYFVLAVVDGDEVVEESDESNNQFNVSITFAAIEIPLALNDFSVKIYPNPVSEILNIDFAGAGHYLLSDFSGRTISQGKLNDSNKIDVSRLNGGVYLLSIKSDQPLFTRKIRINH